jgi:hypothetical protein
MPCHDESVLAILVKPPADSNDPAHKVTVLDLFSSAAVCDLFAYHLLAVGQNHLEDGISGAIALLSLKHKETSWKALQFPSLRVWDVLSRRYLERLRRVLVVRIMLICLAMHWCG